MICYVIEERYAENRLLHKDFDF